MKKRYLIIPILIIIIIITCIFFKNKKDDKYYVLKDDKIKSITSIVGQRKLSKKTNKKYNSTIIKSYKYNKVKDPYTDLSKYILYLEQESNFINTKNYNLNNNKGSIQLSRYSTNKSYIIIMDIRYNSNSYTIRITRGKGKITPLNKS